MAEARQAQGQALDKLRADPTQANGQAFQCTREVYQKHGTLRLTTRDLQ